MKLEELEEKEQVIECIKALSRIDGIVRYIDGNGLKQDETLYTSIDTLMQYLDRVNKDLDVSVSTR
jgi:hypothetical protein